MKKDFDNWNKLKKGINSRGENKFYQPRDIWWCSMGINIGTEANGKGEDYGRPVGVIKCFNKESFLGVALTGKKKTGTYYMYLGKVKERDASANLSQIRLYDTKRLVNKMGRLDEKIFEIMRKAVKAML